MRVHRRTAARAVLYPVLGFALVAGGLAQPAHADNHLPWQDTSLSPEERTELLIDAMTLDQKISQLAITVHDDTELEECNEITTARQILPIPELGIPTMRFVNAGTGIRGGTCENPVATGLPSAPLAAATFDLGLNHEWGEILAAEAKAYAHQVLLGPAANLHRTPYGGRTWEYPSEDPFLAGAIVTEQVRGIQSQGIHAQPKHFVGNESEYERWTSASIIPSRAMHELYLLPFEMIVKDGDPASIMCAFPDLNRDYACENEALLQTVLRDRWGFDGYVYSDRRAVHSTVPSIEAGLNVELDFEAVYYSEERIRRYLLAGRITVAQIDELLRPRFEKMFEYGFMDEPFDEFTIDLTVDDEVPDELTSGFPYEEHGATAREIAEAGVVLLKNEDDFLPLDGEAQSIALIGAEWYAGMAKLPQRGSDNANVFAPYTVTPQEGLENIAAELGHDIEVTYNNGEDIDSAVELAEDADLVILMAGDNPHETQDRETLDFPEIDVNPDDDVEEWRDQSALLEAVVGVNDNTVLVLKTAATVLMPWLDEVPAVVQAWYPGQEDGHVVADVLYGNVNPSGKLPMTWGTEEREAAFTTEEQYPGVRIDTGRPGGPGFYGDDSPQNHVMYQENLEMGYRWYEANGVEPLYPFGFGLSYTTFEYSDVELVSDAGPGQTTVEAHFTVTNTGDVAGAEAAQVYLTLPDEADQPSKRLVGFDKVHLEPGESERVAVTIDSTASNHPFDYWVPTYGLEDIEDPDDWADQANMAEWEQGEWVRADGTYTVHVGTSSAQTPLEQDVDLVFRDGPGDEGDIPIEATVPGGGGPGDEPGSLTLTIEDFGASVDLGEAVKAFDRLRFTGELPAVTVTDTRNDGQAGGTGWSVSGVAEDFTATEEEAPLGAEHLGWVPWVEAGERNGVDPGPPVDGVLDGGPGLADPQELVSATAEGRFGQATAAADLILEVPLESPAGEYRSSINLSLFPVD